MKDKPLSRWFELLEHPDPDARAEAADALREYASDDVVERLATALDDDSYEVREAAIDSLASISIENMAALYVLGDALRHQCPHTREKSASELCIIMPEAALILPKLLPVLADENPDFQAAAAKVLDDLESFEMEVFPRLEAYTREGTREERIGAIRGLVFVQAYSEWRIDALSEVVDDDDPAVRKEARKALQEVRNQPWREEY